MLSEENDNIRINDNDTVKIFEGLKHSEIINNSQLFQILELNAEQLTYYLENFILDNPFINLEYSIEKTIPAFEKFEHSDQVKDLQANSQSLDTYLFEQILLYRKTEIRDAMVMLIELLDDRGYLPYSLEELSERIHKDKIITLDALTLVQQLEPKGIGAYDLQDCLMIQTDQDPYAPEQAYDLLKDYYQELMDQDYVEIENRSHYSKDEILEAVNYYHMLRRNPAALFDKVAKINLIPDISVQPSGEGISIRYNRQYYPKVSFDNQYYEDMKARDDQELQAYIAHHLNSYQKLANNLRLRERLILDIIQSIVRHQRDFFYAERDHLSPLSLREIASDVRLPEQLVSRVISNKNLEFNNHVYAVSDFINVSLLQTREGLSANYIKDLIQDIINHTEQSLTDGEIVKRLEEKNIIIGEQVVHNYRHALER